MSIREKMEEALKERIRRDDPANFDAERWKKIRLGITYEENDEWVDAAVLESTEATIGEDRYLPKQAWRTLIDEVGVETKAGDAVGSMVNAFLRSERVAENDEGPITGRPKSRPKLKRRDEK